MNHHPAALTDLHPCFETINEALAKQGSRLSLASPDDGKPAYPRVMVEDTVEGSGASATRNMIAACCPFCGDVLDPDHTMASPTRPWKVQTRGMLPCP